MIIHEDTAPFGGRVTDINTSKFTCVVTTAKEGIFKGLSTMVAKVDDIFGSRHCAKIIYTSSARKKDRSFMTLLRWGLMRPVKKAATCVKQSIL